jgi:major membrane immunogen (membrane-anchored lipoprotein)
MKRLIRLLLLMPLLAACEQEVYDKGDTAYSYMRADFVDATVDGDKNVTTVTTDDGQQLQLTSPFTAKWITTPDTTYRTVMYYNLKGEQAEVINMRQLATMTIKSIYLFKGSFKSDPLTLESAWLGGNKRYLNLGVIMKVGAVNQDDELQTVGVFADTLTVDDDGLRTYHIRLYHDQGGVPQYYSQRYFLSIPVGGLKADSLRLTVNTYDGMVVKGFRLRE